jgi:peptidoglycan/LPS O-acetylase OafA/YrhL
MLNELKQKPGYRSDVDGLRAIAVLSVVFFHAYPATFQSGFIGVDVFFVISGFLITRILINNFSKSVFSLFDFYSKRILRIFPALIAVLLFVMILGWWTLNSTEYSSIGKHVLLSSFFVSNFGLWAESGYFDVTSEQKPLLHLWSLAIEEQFYLFYPIIFWMLYRYNISRLLALLIIICISFSFNFIGFLDDGTVFYMLFSRAWELLVGAIIAVLLYEHQMTIGIHLKAYRSVFMVFGLGLMLSGFYFNIAGVRYPNLFAVLPVLGSALVILSGSFSSQTILYKILSNPILVWVGKISYPLYLWHWIIFVLTYVITGEVANLYFKFFFILLSIVFASLTLNFVEVPFRKSGPSKKKVILLFLILIFVGLLGGIIWKKDGFQRRDASLQSALYEGDIGHDIYREAELVKYTRCNNANYLKNVLVWKNIVRCAQSSANPSWALMGDSHAEHLFYGLANEWQNIGMVYLIRASAPYAESSDFIHLFEEVNHDPKIKGVILSAHWINRTVNLELMRSTLKKLLKSGKKIVIFGDNPVFGFEPDRCQNQRLFRSSTGCTQPRSLHDQQSSISKAVFKSLMIEFPQVKFIDLTSYFCNALECSMVKGRELLYRDANHFNLNGTKYVAKMLKQIHPDLLDPKCSSNDSNCGENH